MELWKDNRMQIEIGKTYFNRTAKYLLPSFKLYGDTFRAKFNTIKTLAFGIHDALLDGTPYEEQRLVYILIDKLVKPLLYTSFIAWVKLQEYYVTDYSYDDIESGRKHMLVIAYPEKHADIYDKFLEGKYSKMYVKNEITEFFGVGREEARGTLLKTKEAAIRHTDNLNERFKTNITAQCLIDEVKEFGGEYDYPPEKSEEIFNYNQNLEGVQVNL